MQDGEQRWRRRPLAAFLIIVVVRLLPIAASFASGVVLGNITGRPTGLLPSVLWLLGLLVVSTIVLVVADRVASRALPLASLLKLSMLVPDHTPSRFTIALRSHNTTHLLRSSPEEPGESAAMVLALISQLNAHDRRTRGHSERVRAYTEVVAEELRLSERDRDMLRWAGLLHDIGKLRVSKATLNKPGKPNEREWEELKRHPSEGAKIVAPLKPWLGHWASAVVQHHERWDGRGYPGGLAGLQISLGGRIVAVADAFETMTAVRAYKQAMSLAEAREELVRCAGTHFDPVVVRAFMRVSLGRLRVLMGPLAWLAEQPFLAGVGQAGVRVASAGAKAGVGVAAAGAMTGAALSGGLPEVVEHRPITVTTSVPVDAEVEGRGLIDVFIRQRLATTSSSSSSSSSSTTSSTTTVVP